MISSAVGSALYKRATSVALGNVPEYQLPSWTWILVVLNVVLFFPVFLWLNYTIAKVWPVFAIVEDQNPPPYEPLALDEDGTAADAEPAISGQSGAVSSSARSIHRLLMANGGILANFRGFFCLATQGFLTSILIRIFAGTLGMAFTPIATLLASLTLAQFSTAWVHITITRRSPLHFWSRLPAFNRTFNATWKSITLYWAASEVNRWLPRLVAFIIGLELPELQDVNPGYADEIKLDPTLFWGAPIILIVSLLSMIFVVIPAQVVLFRVQASLLPVEEDTIISFDRSFEGQVEPVIASGKGYATVSQAWSTFTTTAWRRLIFLYIKIFAIGAIASVLLLAVLIPEIILVISNSRKIE